MIYFTGMHPTAPTSLFEDLLRVFRAVLLALLVFQIGTSGWLASSLVRGDISLASFAITIDHEGRLAWAAVETCIALVFLLMVPWRKSNRHTWFLALWLAASLAIDIHFGFLRTSVFAWFFFWMAIGSMGALLTTLGFRILKIRGKILMVCLVAAGLPMLMVGVALSQQYQFIERHALPTVAREALYISACGLDAGLSKLMSEHLGQLLGISPGDLKRLRFPFEIASPSVYWDRASRLDLPLLEVSEESVVSLHNLDLREIPLGFALKMIARSGGMNLVVKGSLPTTQVSITGRNLTVDDMLRQVMYVCPLEIRSSGNQMLVDCTVPRTASDDARITSSIRSSILGSSKRLTELQEYADKHPDIRVKVSFDAEGEKQTLLLYLLKRSPDDGKLLGTTKVAIDQGAWLKHLIMTSGSSLASGSICLHSTSFSGLKPVFSGFQMAQNDDGKKQTVDSFFEQPELQMRQSFAHAIRDGKPLIEQENISPFPIPALIGPTADLRISDPAGKEWLLQGWSLPRSTTTVTFAIPVCTLREYLFEKQKQPLILAAIAILMAFFLSFAYSRGMSLPLQAITEAARRIRDGDLDVQIPAPGGNDEIRELSEALGVMAERLKGRIVSANQRLVEEKYKFEALLESTWEGIFLLTRDGCLAYANQAGRQLLGETALGKPLTELLTGLGQEFQPPLPPSFAGINGDFRTHFQLPDPDGGKRKVLALYLRPLPESLGMLAVCRDVTVEKEIDRMKSEFVSQVSHELRTPLTSIQAYTEMLLDGEAEDATQQKDYLGIILDESQRLTRLINDLLDIARIESGKRVLKPVKLDLGTLSRDILLILGGQAERRRLTVEVSVPADPVWFTGDADLIKQAGLNLLSNALKYTPEGGRVSISAEALPGPQAAWRFTDSGIGMTPQERDRLFTKFFRADSEYVKNAGGTGLGLTLVKQIIDRHGGEIRVESELGKGSTFTLLFPGQLAN